MSTPLSHHWSFFHGVRIALTACFLIPKLGGAWDLDRDTSASPFFPSGELIVVGSADERRVVGTNPIEELPGAEAVSLGIVFEPGDAAWRFIYVYDRNGVLRERIDAGRVTDEFAVLWTAFVRGSTASIRVEAAAGSEFKVRIVGAVVEGRVGEMNAVHGTPNFEPLAALEGEGASWVAPLVASLVVDPNAEDLNGVTPGWSYPCTGVLIAPNLLLTAGHCTNFTEDTCASTVALFGLRHGVEDRPEIRRCTAVRYLGHSLDAAVLELDGTGPAGPFPSLSMVPPEEDSELAILHHPRGTFARVSRDGECRVAQRIARLWPSSNRANPELVDKAGFIHHCDTLSGSSGAPVLTADGQRILGIQHAGYEHSGENYATRADYIRECIQFKPANGGTLAPRTDLPYCE